MRLPAAALAISLALCHGPRLPAQTRSLAQDSTLDNLRYPAGYRPAQPGTLGAVRRLGAGSRSMILIPGIGFGGDVFAEFMERRKDRFTMFAVTLPGFGGTAGLPLPEPGTSIRDHLWTNSAVTAVLDLMNRERIGRATLVSHWLFGTQVAFRLVLEHPDRFDALILIGGVAESYYSNTPAMLDWTLEQRIRSADGLAMRWFRTVTRKTWDDQNFMSYDYAINPLRGLFLWREAAMPSLPAWIRYLLESYAQDPTILLSRLKTPTLVIKPGFDDPAMFVDDGRDYMTSLTHDSWRNVEGKVPAIEFATIPASRLFVWFDQPAKLDETIDDFLRRKVP